MLSETRISNAYNALRMYMRDAREADEAVLDAKNDIATKTAGLTLAGQITGKNEAEREASKRTLLAEEYKTLAAAESAQRLVYLALRLAETEVEQLRLEVRLAELRAKGATGDAYPVE